MLCAAMYAEYFQHTSPVNSSRLIRSPVATDRSGEPVRWNQSHAFALQAPAIRSPRLCWRLPTGNLVAGRRTGVSPMRPARGAGQSSFPRSGTDHARPAYLRRCDRRRRADRRACQPHAGDVLAYPRRRTRRGSLLQMRKPAAHGSVQVPRRLQRAVAVFRRAACRRGGGVLLRQPRPGHRPLGALAGDPGDHRDAGRRAGGEDRGDPWLRRAGSAL